MGTKNSENVSSDQKEKKSKLGFIAKIIEFKLKAANFFIPVVDLGIRLWMANIFWKSGVLKLPSGFLGIGKGNWDSTLYLFEYEHPIPFLPVEFAAFVGTGFEILCPILLIIGLGSRGAAFILLAMSAFIELTYIQNIEHIFWMILLSVTIFHGPGKLSLDHVIRKKALNCPKYREMAGIKEETS